MAETILEINDPNEMKEFSKLISESPGWKEEKVIVMNPAIHQTQIGGRGPFFMGFDEEVLIFQQLSFTKPLPSPCENSVYMSSLDNHL